MKVEYLSRLKSSLWDLFFLSMQNKRSKSLEKKIIDNFSNKENAKTFDFVFDLVKIFTKSFYEESIAGKTADENLNILNQLINQQITIFWINKLVDRSITPLLLFSVKKSTRIDEIKQTINRILIAVILEEINAKEAENQIKIILKNDYNVSEVLILFIKSLIKSFSDFKEKHSLMDLAVIGKTYLKSMLENRTQEDSFWSKAIKDPIFERKKIIDNWLTNVLQPTSIGLHIGGEQKYNNFINNCKENFELFLDRTLSAEDFEKRLDGELRKFGGEKEELIRPIRESIASYIKFLELARVDDPSLSFLVTIIDEERDSSRKSYT